MDAMVDSLRRGSEEGPPAGEEPGGEATTRGPRPLWDNNFGGVVGEASGELVFFGSGCCTRLHLRLNKVSASICSCEDTMSSKGGC